jgi:hypothetical protein
MAVDPTKLDTGDRVRFGELLRRRFPRLPGAGTVVHKPRADAVSVRPNGWASYRYYDAALLEPAESCDSRGAA